ncbi:hypothetical protein [Janthinobacterium agaricidamnosum]|uniref:Uncharacterized protein n=1 Tax=Janthinobacterium agaricidamnosum NBRC 102515 = DSM 9628 TaxID=1349767 RepID=W0V977_9BURK|nr:hypothetical protein [Janthinobacterium agaricidamnosum]CDG84145.1 hypothetical protein GJA_3529 [Janthinobacterium agaricidamnosum NBRC 102515 = DSM 9628]
MADKNQARAVAIKRLAGLTGVVAALLSAFEILEDGRQLETLDTCADMAGEIADELDKLARNAS